MRYALFLMVLSAFFLGGCNGEAATVAPETTPEQAAATPEGGETGTTAPQGTTPEGEQTPDVLAEAGVTIAPAGTIIAPATEDPNEGQGFTSILYIQTGGLSNMSLTVEVYPDGRVVRNGATSNIPPEQVQQISAALDQLNFFGLQGSFTAAGGKPEEYRYSLTVERADGSSRTINAQDNYTPPELLSMFAMINTLGSGDPTSR